MNRFFFTTPCCYKIKCLTCTYETSSTSLTEEKLQVGLTHAAAHAWGWQETASDANEQEARTKTSLQIKAACVSVYHLKTQRNGWPKCPKFILKPIICSDRKKLDWPVCAQLVWRRNAKLAANNEPSTLSIHLCYAFLTDTGTCAGGMEKAKVTVNKTVHCKKPCLLQN